VPRFDHHEAVPVSPGEGDLVPCSRDRQPQNIEAGADVADRARGKGRRVIAPLWRHQGRVPLRRLKVHGHAISSAFLNPLFNLLY
jgi:hypothetical protein